MLQVIYGRRRRLTPKPAVNEGHGTVGTVSATCPIGVRRKCGGASLLARSMSPMVPRVHLQGLAEERRKTLALEVVVAMAREVMRRVMCWIACPRIVDACGFPTGSHIMESHDKPGQGVLGLPLARTWSPPCWVFHGTEPAGAVLGRRRRGEAWRQRRQRSTVCPVRTCCS